MSEGGVPSLLVVLLVLVPLCVGWYYEKYYTQKWSALWNIYGVIVTGIGLLFSYANIIDSLPVLLGIIGLGTLAIYLLIKGKKSLFKFIGSSGVILTIMGFLILLVYYPGLGYYIFAIPVCFLIFSCIRSAYYRGWFRKFRRKTKKRRNRRRKKR